MVTQTDTIRVSSTEAKPPTLGAVTPKNMHTNPKNLKWCSRLASAFVANAFQTWSPWSECSSIPSIVLAVSVYPFLLNQLACTQVKVICKHVRYKGMLRTQWERLNHICNNILSRLQMAQVNQLLPTVQASYIQLW